jgi:cytochrome c-type biogenesis protein CcmF
MIPEIGHFALFLALCLAAMQVIIPLRGVAAAIPAYMQLSRYTAWGQFILTGLAIATLAVAFLTNDFSVMYVAENSNSHLPAIYRFCAVWGAHEGSLLLWVFILSGWMAAISIFSRSLPAPITARVLAVLAIIAIGFYLFLLTTSSPFTRLLPNIPADGADLNPILQDPGLAVHPPMLYMGYVGFAVPFAFAMAALLSGRLDPQWARWSRPWTLIAWCFLTLGIVLGSAWAYRELGWGGWWFWDPVENASFLPWLAGTALIHSLAVTEKRRIFKAWTVLLAVCAFSLSLLGTFLVRSGVLVSVHSFAADPQRGLYMLGFLLFVVGSSLTLYAWRGRALATDNQFTLASRESLLLMNNILLLVAMLTVLLGTLYPLIIDALHLGKISVGPPYFNLVFMPLMAPLFLLMAIAPLFQWRTSQISHLRSKIVIYLILVLTLAILLPLLFGVKITLWFFCALAIALWIILWTLHHGFTWRRWLRPRRLALSQWAMVTAHLGIGVTVIGIICSTAYSQQRDVSMHQGDIAQVGPYQFKFLNITEHQGPNYRGLQSEVAVLRDDQVLRVLQPEQRFFPVANTAATKAAIDAGVFRDLYVALGSALPDGAWSFRIYYKPFIRWIWAGGILMMCGGLLAVADRRYRLTRGELHAE